MRPRILILLFALGVSCFSGDQSSAQEPAKKAAESLLPMLEKMVADDPTKADTWRMLGRIYRKQNRLSDAANAFNKTLELQPDNAAAHFDLGELLAFQGRREQADFHFDEVMRLAPESKYAQTLVERGERLPATNPIQPASFEIQTFDGADDLNRRVEQLTDDTTSLHNIRAFIEFGALYNTNLALAPISRELAASSGSGFQGFLSPDVEYAMFQGDVWRSGPILRGFFTANEGNFANLNLASFQPGVFVERDLPSFSDNPMIGRVDYVYSLDLLGGTRFGDRHAITTSLTAIPSDQVVWYSYLTASLSNFADDGADASVDSLDGTSITAGVSRFRMSSWSWLPSWGSGLDIESTNAEGADFRYHSVNWHHNVTFQPTQRLSFIPDVGVGYRNYYDFTGSPSRDEATIRLGAKWKLKVTEHVSFSTVINHNRFASLNEAFDTERTEAGVVCTITR